MVRGLEIVIHGPSWTIKLETRASSVVAFHDTVYFDYLTNTAVKPNYRRPPSVLNMGICTNLWLEFSGNSEQEHRAILECISIV